MHKLFLDANVLFAATCSKSGASFAIFELGRYGKVELFSSVYAVKEAKVNIEKKLGVDALPMFYELISNLKTLDSQDCEGPFSYEGLIASKDLPILESARRQRVDFLITLDKKDFKTRRLAEADLPFQIVLPGEYLISRREW